MGYSDVWSHVWNDLLLTLPSKKKMFSLGNISIPMLLLHSCDGRVLGAG